MRLPTIALGLEHFAVIGADNTLYTWGDNQFGQLGTGNTTIAAVPTPILCRLERIVSVASGYSHNIALSSGGSVYAWGRNDDGQVGNNTTTNVLSPVLLEHVPSGVSCIARGSV